MTEVCSGRDAVDERTLFGYSPKMAALLWERFEVARKYKLKVERKNYIRMKTGGVLVSLVSAFVIIILLQPVASGAMTVGLFMSMEQAGVEHESKTYPNGVETILSREFDGVDLSGGQWQRIAIARGLYRPHDLIVLDEPTAAIDPIEESRLYEKFTQLAMDKTAIIITHRLTSAQLADRIIVMKKGQIVEEGSHEELMMTNELYAKMYKTQKQWYMN